MAIGEHGWWQGCRELNVPGYDAFSVEGANFNRTVDATMRDPISGTPAHRTNLCEARLVGRAPISEELTR